MASSSSASTRAQRSYSAGAEPSITGASASTACSGLSSSSSRAASAMRIPARSRCSALETGERESRGLRVAHPHPYLESPAAHVDREHVLAGEQPFAGSARARTPPGLRRSGPRRSAACRGRGGARPRSPGRLRVRSDSSARARWRSASAKRPIRTSAMPAIANAPVVIDWLVQPCSSAIASARSLSSSASGSGCPVSGAAIARCARQPTSMNGREIRRVRSSASSRCCRASSGRPAHSSAMPRFISASAR